MVNRNKRRGVVLLVVLGLLAMFALVAVAFVVLARQARRGAITVKRIDEVSESPRENLHQAAKQILRGNGSQFVLTENAGTPFDIAGIGPHSLLEDMYGVPLADAELADVPNAICGGQLLSFNLSNAGTAATLPRLGGCVMTFYTGPAAGMSTRLVGMVPVSNGQFSFLALPFKGNVIPNAGDWYVINGRPFSGTGFGYNEDTGDTSRASALGPLGLLPWSPENLTVLDPNHPSFNIFANGANEDYDAVDYNNVLLAGQFQDASGQVITIPSLHRPALASYWGSASPEIARYISARPNYVDHPVFAQNNPNYTATAGPWDVDNDGDGIPDSVWVDLGFPVHSTKDGRQYKPLFAILCLDMDGRLNLNAHGCYSQAGSDASSTTVESGEQPGGGANESFAGGGQTATLARGLGYSPCEINLLPALSGAQGMYHQLLFGGSGYDGRYGELGVPAPGPGLSSSDDNRSWNKTYHSYRGNYWSFFAGTPTARGAFASPPDLDGNGAIGLDTAGRPMYLSMGSESLEDDPNEIDLSDRRTYGVASPGLPDNPFSTAEFQAIQRPFDRDGSSLPRRLRDLAGAALIPNRHIVSTESWDLPVPGGLIFTQNGPGPLTDLIQSKGVTSNSLIDFLPAEILSGMRMDVNRLFGNGRDDDGDGVVDDYDEQEKCFQYALPGNGWSGDFSHDPYGRNSNPLVARQEYAKHLYIMLMALSDLDTLDQMLGGNREATAQYLAQWAINAVDFRDADATMTPFPYDPSPFDGWNADINDVAHVVWGCERPELLITETLAFHDRRTEDLKDYGWCDEEQAQDEDETEEKSEDGDGKKDLDQQYIPQGSLVIELFNPWNTREVPSGELYGPVAGGQSGVILNKKAPGGSPVWRLIICEGDEAESEHRDPDDPDVARRPTIERSIYFTTPPAGGDDGQQYNPSQTNEANIEPIEPGRYAVIGPGEDGAAGGVTYIGFEDGETEGSSTTRQIDLDGTDTEVVKNSGQSVDGSSIYPPARVIIDEPRRLSVSEPIDGYSESYDSTGLLDAVLDEPLDETANSELWGIISRDDTEVGFRVVHLQRLANPQAAFDPVQNPYRTIDSMPIDLTTFNGLSTLDEDGTDVGNREDVPFQSRQRGERASSLAVNNLWKQEPLDKVLGAGGAGDPPDGAHYFEAPLLHSLGYLNTPFGNPTVTGATRGNPQEPFPWLNFNNRPYISQLEMLLVPAVRSSKLLIASNQGQRGYYGFIDGSAAAVTAYAPTAINQLPYPHLMNFFDSSRSQLGTGGATGGGTGDKSPELHRIFEYLRAPSPFVGTTLHTNPESFRGLAHPFNPPFNRIPTYREPGRINLNTVFDHRVMQGLLNFRPELNNEAFWSEFVRSRRGYGDVGDSTICLQMQGAPTFFAAPFRTAIGGSMVPLEPMKPAREIDATVMRSGLTSAVGPRPLFHRKIAYKHSDTDRNPFFHYQALQRLGNLTTTRSNVYAAWITMGYFEVSTWPGGADAGHPDGLQIGREVGLDSGDIKRHRAFYMFDRSIPVGFARGKDLNVEDAIIARRFIE